MSTPEKAIKWGLYLQIGFWLTLIGGLVLVIFNFKAILKAIIDAIFGNNTTSSTILYWKNKFGLLPPGTKIPDSTGDLGAQVEASSQASATAAAAPQISYDLARSAYMKARGLSAAWDDPMAAGWKWASFDDWTNAGMPSLQT